MQKINSEHFGGLLIFGLIMKTRDEVPQLSQEFFSDNKVVVKRVSWRKKLSHKMFYLSLVVEAAASYLYA